jgi:hypothetical protein
LSQLIGRIISEQARAGCGLIRSHEHQHGKFPCTLGCGRRFRAAADAFRHEEIVYPQNFWFCHACGDLEHPSKKHLFLREDKMRRHLRNHGLENISIDQCRVLNVPNLLPERCDLCSHHRHSSWKERSKHIIWHCKKGHYNADTYRGGSRSPQRLSANAGNDDDDDDADADADDDDRDNDDGGGHSGGSDTNKDQDNGEGPSGSDGHHSNNGGGFNHDPPSTEDANFDLGDFVGDFPDFWDLLNVNSTLLQSRFKIECEKSMNSSMFKPVTARKQRSTTGPLEPNSFLKFALLASSLNSRVVAVKRDINVDLSFFERGLSALGFVWDGNHERGMTRLCYGLRGHIVKLGPRQRSPFSMPNELRLQEHWDQRSGDPQNPSHVVKQLEDTCQPRLDGCQSTPKPHDEIQLNITYHMERTPKLTDCGSTFPSGFDSVEDTYCDVACGGTSTYSKRQYLLATQYNLH